MNISIKSHDDSSFSLQFLDGFSTPILNAVRNVPGRRWDDKNKIWLIPDNQKAANQLLQNIFETGLFNLPQRDFEKTAASRSQDSIINSEIRKLTEALTVRHYSDHTKQCYKKWVEDFLQKYLADLGRDNLHQNDLQEEDDENKTIEEALKNILPVCPNCHRVIHRNKIYGMEGIQIFKASFKNKGIYTINPQYGVLHVAENSEYK